MAWTNPNVVQTGSGSVTTYSQYAQPVLQTDLNGNGISWNTDGITLISSAAYTSTQTSADQTNYNARGVILYINTGSFGSGFSNIVVNLRAKDPVSGNYVTLVSSSALTASTFSAIVVYPGASGSGTASLPLPKTWQVQITATAWGTGGSTVGVACAVLI
jgi:hypothetical protein